LRALEQSTAPERLAELQRDADPVLNYLNANDAHGTTLVAFSNASQDLFWTRELRVPLDAGMRWDEKPFVRPLVEALDEYECCAAVVLNHEHARLYTVCLGEIELRDEIIAPEKRKHIKSPGNDVARSQVNLQRKEDENASRHFKEVAEHLEKLAAKSNFRRIVIAGQREAAVEFQSALPKRLQQQVVGAVPLPMEAGDADVSREVQKVQEGIERTKELEVVERLITAAHKVNQGVLSIQPTLDAMRLGSIMQLVYAEGYKVPGCRCRNCQTMFVEGARCSYCDSDLKPVDDVVSRLVEMVVDSGGDAENVRGPAADRLKQAGGIGAFLRF
jgi:peptide subunit release factor 1 (eRF1)